MAVPVPAVEDLKILTSPAIAPGGSVRAGMYSRCLFYFVFVLFLFLFLFFVFFSSVFYLFVCVFVCFSLLNFFFFFETGCLMCVSGSKAKKII